MRMLRRIWSHLRVLARARRNRTDLAAEVAWENQRGRLHHGLGVRPAGFSDGAFCVLPEPGAAGR